VSGMDSDEAVPMTEVRDDRMGQVIDGRYVPAPPLPRPGDPPAGLPPASEPPAPLPGDPGYTP
jgi:hypothetical protein